MASYSASLLVIKIWSWMAHSMMSPSTFRGIEGPLRSLQHVCWTTRSFESSKGFPPSRRFRLSWILQWSQLRPRPWSRSSGSTVCWIDLALLPIRPLWYVLGSMAWTCELLRLKRRLTFPWGDISLLPLLVLGWCSTQAIVHNLLLESWLNWWPWGI